MISTEHSFDEKVHQQSNDSIIKKVKSRVSNIFPNVVNWFSSGDQSTNNNGSVRRRRESESDDDENDKDQQTAVDSSKIKYKRRKSEMNDSHYDLAGPSTSDRRPSMSHLSTPSQYNSKNRYSELNQQLKTSSPYHFASHNPHMSIMASPIHINDSSDDDDDNDKETDELELVQEESLITSINKRKGIHETQQFTILKPNSTNIDRSISEPPAGISLHKSSHLNYSYEGNKATTMRLHCQGRDSNNLQNEVIIENDDYDGNIINGNDAAASEFERENLSERDDNNGGTSESERLIKETESNLVRFPQPSTSRQDSQKGRLSGFLGNRNKTMSASTGTLSFQVHLETEKSLFSERNAFNRRSFNPSIYGSSWSLNSAATQNRPQHTLSPFYGGRTIYGGASVYSRREHRLQQTLRIPTMIRPSSGLSNTSSTSSLASGDNVSVTHQNTGLSNTSKRILELLDQCTSPLKDARKIGTGLNTSNCVPVLLQSKRFNEDDLNLSRINRSKVSKTPYSRPKLSLPVTNELQVPSISQLLQMKKRLQNSTEQVRKLATGSKNTLNERVEYTLPSKNIQNTIETNGVKHVNKVKVKVAGSTRACTKNTQIELETGPVLNLPNIEFPTKSAPKIDLSSTASTSKCATSLTSNPTSNSTVSKSMLAETRNFIKTTTTTPAINNCSVSSDLVKFQNNRFTFSSPVSICNKQIPDSVSTRNFTFSKPLPFKSIAEPIPKEIGFKFDASAAKKINIAEKSSIKEAVSAETGSRDKVPELKQTSCLEALFGTKKITNETSNFASTGFGSQFKMASNQWECGMCMIRNNDSANKCVACETPKPNVGGSSIEKKPSPTMDEGFKNIIAAQKTKWSCSVCMSQNDQSADKCLACCEPKPGGNNVIKKGVEKSEKQSTTVTDEMFKNLVAQQNTKWSCSICLTQNEQTRTKCAACEQLRPGSVPGKVPQFSFGSNSSSGKFTFGVPTAEPTAMLETKNKQQIDTVMFGSQSTSTSTSANSDTVIKPGFTFGVQPIDAKDSSKNLPSAGFTFNTPSTKSFTANKTDTNSKVNFSSTSGTGIGTSDGTQAVSSSTTNNVSFYPKPNSVTNPVEMANSGNKQSSDEKIKSVPDASKPFTFGKTNEAQAKSNVNFGTLSTNISSTGFSFVKPATPSLDVPVKLDGKKDDNQVSSTVTISTTSTPMFGTNVTGIKPLDRSAFSIKPATSSSEGKPQFIFGAAKKEEGIKPAVGGFTFGISSIKPIETTTVTTQSVTSSIFSKNQLTPKTDSTKAAGFAFPTTLQKTDAKDINQQPLVFGTLPNVKTSESPFGNTQKTDITPTPTFDTFDGVSNRAEPEKKTTTFGSAIFGAPNKSSTSTSPFSFVGSDNNNINSSHVTPTQSLEYGGGVQQVTPVFSSKSSTFESGQTPQIQTSSPRNNIFSDTTTPFGQMPNANINMPLLRGSVCFGPEVNRTPPFGTSGTASPFSGSSTEDEASNKKLKVGFGFSSAESSSVNSAESGNMPFMFGNRTGSDNNNSKQAFNFSPTVKPTFNFSENQPQQNQTIPVFEFGASNNNNTTNTFAPGSSVGMQQRRKIKGTRRILR